MQLITGEYCCSLLIVASIFNHLRYVVDVVMRTGTRLVSLFPGVGGWGGEPMSVCVYVSVYVCECV